MTIAILYICTGKYSVFWDAFYATSEMYFFSKADKTYYVFTDDNKLIKRLGPVGNVHCYFQRCAGWPYDTLLRFNTFTTIQDLLKKYDYCFFWNANAVFLKPVDESVIPLPQPGKELVLWRHTNGYEYDSPDQFETEKNPESMAYIPPGKKCYNYGGGFFGGTPTGFINMSVVLRERIARDLEKGIIAVWHDQSHLVKYGSEVDCVEVPKDVIVSEEYMEGKDPYVIFSNKQHVGGMYKLRGMPLGFRIKARIYDAGRRFLGFVGLKQMVKRIIGKL